MASLNDSMTIARSGIEAAQTRLSVISHNISNINTDGYHTQQTVLGTNPPLSPNSSTISNYDIGTGVSVMDVTRAYNQTQETQYLALNSTTATNTTLSNTLQSLESLTNSTVSGGALTDYLNNFWAAWQNVANDPSDMSMRSALLESSATLTQAFNSVAANLDSYNSQLISGTGPAYTGAIASDVEEINSDAAQIQTLNAQINTAKVENITVNDLMDKRDSLVKDISGKAGITLDTDGTIKIDGQVLVSGDGTVQNNLTITSGSPPQFTLAGNSVTISGGELDGYVQTTGTIASLQSQLDTFASELINQVNTLHTAGYDLSGTAGVDFFTGTGADNIQVSSALYNSANPLLSHPELVAASTTLTPGTPPTPNVGDGTNALAIADLANSNLPDLSNQTFAGYFTNMTTDLGAQAQSATEVSDDNTTALNAYQTAIQGTDGVNLDEELLDMMSAQRAFEAASKVATTTDSMLNTLINVMT